MKLSHPRISKVLVLAQYIMKKDTWEFIIQHTISTVRSKSNQILASYNDIFTPLF